MAIIHDDVFIKVSHIQINNSESVYDTEIVNTPVINFIIDYYIISRSINLTFNIDIQDQGFCNDSKGIQLCKHEYDISLTTFQQSVCDYQTNIIVSVSARNAFGHGPANNTSIGKYMNMHALITCCMTL